MSTRLTFHEYERLAARTDVAGRGDLKSIMIPLLGLAGEVGSLLSEHKKHLREGERYSVFTDHVAEEIGDILWYLANIANKSGLSLAEIADENLAKLAVSPPPGAIAARTRRVSSPARWFDEGFPRAEQLPRRLRVEFREVREPSGMRLRIYRDGKQVGQSLTDNAHYDDGYRYHDVFHLSCAILLGWSPITRRILDVKRRSKHHFDEIEDGGRAGVTEEAVSALVFAHARDYSYFQGATSIDYELLSTIVKLVRPFEVRTRGPREWESVILKAYSVWRRMKENRGGVFVGDALSGSVAYEAAGSAAASATSRSKRPSVTVSTANMRAARTAKRIARRVQ